MACLFSGWFDHPAVEEDQHEGSPALPDQGDLPVHLHRPGHHCQVRLNNYYWEWFRISRYDYVFLGMISYFQVWGEEEKGQGEDRRSIVELIKAQFESRILWKSCHMWSHCDRFQNHQLHTEPANFIHSYFFKIYYILDCWVIIILGTWQVTTG